MNHIDFSNIELSFTEKLTLSLLTIIKSNRFYKFATLDYLHRLGSEQISLFVLPTFS